MACMVNGREIILSGDVGDMGWGWFDEDPGFTSSDVIRALAQIGDGNDVTIRINSGGGIAWEGSAIHAALSRHSGNKTVIVEGIAASAASVVAMAGDEVVMSLGAMMMVHEPSGFTVGTVKDHQDQINCLNALGASVASIYAAKTGRTTEQCRADMVAECWMTADGAVANGYADRIEGDVATTPEPAPFNYRLYAHAPAPLMALTDARHWNRRKLPAASAAPHANQETPMATKKADDTAASNQGATTSDATTNVDTTAIPRAQAAEIAKMCREGGVPQMAETLLASGATIEQARARINAAGEITSMVTLARRTNSAIPENAAATMIAEGKTVEQARAALFDQLVARPDDPQLATYHRAGAGGANTEGKPAAKAARDSMKANMAAQLARQNSKKEG